VSGAAVALQPARLVPAASPQALDEALDHGRLSAPLCTCHAVATVVLPQADCFRTLLGRTRPAEGRGKTVLRAVKSRALWDLADGKPAVVEAVDPSSFTDDTDEREQITFVTPEALEHPRDLLTKPRVVQLFDLVRVIKRDLFRGYEIGPSLRNQPGSAPLRRRLDRALKFLRATGLIDGRVLGDHHYAHTSVMLLMMRALGISDPGLLPRYVENPGRFVASAVVNGLDVAHDRRARVRQEVEAILWMVAEQHLPSIGGGDVDVAFPAEYGLELLERMQANYADITGRLLTLVTRLPSRRMSVASPSGAGPETGGQSSRHGEGDDDAGRPDMALSWEDFLERERKKLADETALLEQHRVEWLREHRGQFVVISGTRYSFHPTEREALRAGYELAGGDVPFLVERLAASPPVNFVAALG